MSLAIGLSASFVIGVIVYYDLTFDKFHPDGERIYRVTTEFNSPQGSSYNPGITVPLTQALRDQESTLIEAIAPLFIAYPQHVKNKESALVFKTPKYVVYTDPSFFEVFEYQWLAGNKQKAISEPNQVVLSENRAKKYFPNTSLQQIIGKTIIYNDTILTTVSGLVANFTRRTDLVFEEFISLKTAATGDMTGTIKETNWGNTNSASQLFIKIKENADAKNVSLLLKNLAKEHEDKERAAIGYSSIFHMQPLFQIHLDSNYYTFDFAESKASASVLIGLGCTALFLLLLGCINFINLNTSQATQRAKEIGVRKTLGSSKRQLVIQFLGETFLLTMAAAIISIILSKWLLLVFSDFIPQGVSFSLFGSPIILISIIILLLVVTLLSGLYPAVILSNYKPVKVLKNHSVIGQNKSGLRKYLTVFQFTIAQVFIIATLLVAKQLNYMLKKDMGFKTEAIAHFRTPWQDDSAAKKTALLRQITAMSQVTNATIAGNPPASRSTHSRDISFENGENLTHFNLQLLYGDSDYFNLYGLNLLKGRLPLNDTIQEYVVNKAFLKPLGLENPESVVGKFIKSGEEQYLIVGVMDDFNQRSLKSKIEPLAFTGDPDRTGRSQFNRIHFKLETSAINQWPSIIKQMEEVWQKLYPEYEFEYTFVDDSIRRFYQGERKISTLLNWATGLAIVISCLGLFALVIYNTQRRVKEIGIRKVLGASITDLNILLTKEFLMLVGVAFLIAIPIAWYGLNSWLENFAFKTEASWWVFVVSGFAMMLIALVIISMRTIGAAKVNPVKSLRSE